MDQTHIHLIINHLPVFGSMLGALVFTYSLLVKSNHTTMAAYYIFIVSAIGAGIAYLTGEAAEEKVEKIQGVVKNAIEEHEEFAVFALWAFIILGIVSLVGLYLTWKKSNLTKATALVVLLVALFSFGIVAWTGYLGGKIRHSEINSSVVSQEYGGDIEDDD